MLKTTHCCSVDKGAGNICVFSTEALLQGVYIMLSLICKVHFSTETNEEKEC